MDTGQTPGRGGMKGRRLQEGLEGDLQGGLKGSLKGGFKGDFKGGFKGSEGLHLRATATVDLASGQQVHSNSTMRRFISG